MDEGLLVQIRTHGSTFSNNPNEKFLLMILCSQAKLENDNRAKNVCRGMRRKCELGMRPGNTPLGYLVIRWKTSTEKSHVEIDPERAPYIKQMFEWVGNEGFSGRQVWEFIHTKWLRTRNGKKVMLSMVFRILKSPFYYWEFEYPEGSGNWYKWDYEPLITKELYDEVRIRMKVPPKGVWWRKNFYFSRIFKCGCCGSGITWEEKVNRHGKRYIYYRCNRHGGKNTCNEKHIQEKDLIEGLATLCDSMVSYKPLLDKKLTKEVEKVNRMQRMIHGEKSKDITKKEYLNFVFTSGSLMEEWDTETILRETRHEGQDASDYTLEKPFHYNMLHSVFHFRNVWLGESVSEITMKCNKIYDEFWIKYHVADMFLLFYIYVIILSSTTQHLIRKFMRLKMYVRKYEKK